MTMKRVFMLLWIMTALLAAAGLSALAEESAAAESFAAEDEPAEWTVLFYFCGSDLESRYGYASDALAQIGQVRYPDSYLPLVAKENGVSAALNSLPQIPRVNVLIETGGAKRWHAQSPEISANALQRWRYQCFSFYGDETIGDYLTGFELMETLPLQNMADPATLADFIRWGAETCPAKKYALVLWDHGDGARTGMMIDELFDSDIMYLYELKQALADADVQFETVVIDACLMANIETAWALKDNAHWMVASEELVPGGGTAVGDWLQELYANPAVDGALLGRWVCDGTQIKYADEGTEQFRSTLTWSVIDLTKIERLAAAAGRFFQVMGETYKTYPELAITYASYIVNAEEYGDGQQKMRDIAGVFYDSDTWYCLDYGLRREILQALSDAVVYAVRGAGRSAARGLSFCYPMDFEPAELDTYAKNCPSPHYLAFLDAVSNWTAPDWVYEKVDRLPALSSIEKLQLEVTRYRNSAGLPGVIVGNVVNNLRGVCYRLYRVNEETDQTVLLGRTSCAMEWDVELREYIWVANDPMRWPAIDGVPCDMEMIRQYYLEEEEGVDCLYNIPMQIGEDPCFLRCSRVIRYEEGEDQLPVGITSYEVHGVWEGYDENTRMTNRNVTELSKLAGREYRLLYPIDGNLRFFETSAPLTMYRSLEVEEITLPAGDYFIEYEVDDMFERPFVLDRVKLHWDGKEITYPDGFVWEGRQILN